MQTALRFLACPADPGLETVVDWAWNILELRNELRDKADEDAASEPRFLLQSRETGRVMCICVRGHGSLDVGQAYSAFAVW